MITKFNTFVNEEITQYRAGNLQVIYRDNLLTCVVPITPSASTITCRGTNWCSKNPEMFKYWGKSNILFRFLFKKDGYKLRLTWNFTNREIFTWGSGGEKYKEIYGNHPFDIEGIREEIEDDYTELKNDPERYNDRKQCNPEWYKNHMEYYDKLSDVVKNLTNKEYYDDIYNTKKEIVKHIEMIPEVCRQKVISYRKRIIQQNESLVDIDPYGEEDWDDLGDYIVCDSDCYDYFIRKYPHKRILSHHGFSSIMSTIMTLRSHDFGEREKTFSVCLSKNLYEHNNINFMKDYTFYYSSPYKIFVLENEELKEV
jgi:hypothetical protein